MNKNIQEKIKKLLALSKEYSDAASTSGAVYDGVRSGKSVAIHRPLESSCCPVKQIR